MPPLEAVEMLRWKEDTGISWLNFRALYATGDAVLLPCSYIRLRLADMDTLVPEQNVFRK